MAECTANFPLSCSAEGDIDEDILDWLETNQMSWVEVDEAPFLHVQDAGTGPWFRPPRTVFIVDSSQGAEEMYTEHLAAVPGTYEQAYLAEKEGRKFEVQHARFYTCVSENRCHRRRL